MSLRSDSPCTSTSRPIVFLLSARCADLGPAGTPRSRRRRARRLACAARALRTSAVCGNEPMVVVGKARQVEQRRAASARARANGAARCAALASSQRRAALHRRVVHPRRVRGARAAGRREPRLASARARGPPSSARAERRQLVQLLHREGQPRCRRRDRACSRSVEIDRHVQQRAGRRDPQPISPSSRDDGSSRSSSAVESARQMLRPSITPSDSTRSLGQRLRRDRRSGRGARTRSTCRPATGRPTREWRGCRRSRRSRWPA